MVRFNEEESIVLIFIDDIINVCVNQIKSSLNDWNIFLIKIIDILDFIVEVNLNEFKTNQSN